MTYLIPDAPIIQINSKEYISHALKYRLDLINSNHWVRLFKQGNTVEITWGNIWSNGEHEKAIATRTYFMYAGRVEFITTGHL